MSSAILLVASICDAYIFALPAFPALRHAVSFASRLRAQIRCCSRCRPPKLLRTGLEQAYANLRTAARPSKRAPLRKRSSLENAAGTMFLLHLLSPTLAREVFARDTTLPRETRPNDVHSQIHTAEWDGRW